MNDNLTNDKNNYLPGAAPNEVMDFDDVDTVIDKNS